MLIIPMLCHLYQKPHWHKQRFYNHSADRPLPFFLKTTQMFMRSLFKKNNDFSKNEQPLWRGDSIIVLESSCSLIWGGHATFVLDLDGYIIITDPVFGALSPFFRRMQPPGIFPEQLSHVDVVLLSHNHRDHMDAGSLYSLKKFKPTFLVPLGVKQWFDKRKFSSTLEYDWWQSKTMILPNGNKLIVTFLPAHHWSQRGLFDKNKTLWGSWMIEYNGLTIYFAGDSAYAPHFSAIAQSWTSIDVALMPIAPCEPRQWLKESHMDSKEAVQAFCDLGAAHFIPMHWGTFRFGIDSLSSPIERLYTAWHDKALSLPNKQVTVPSPGQRIGIKSFKNNLCSNMLSPSLLESLR